MRVVAFRKCECKEEWERVKILALHRLIGNIMECKEGKKRRYPVCRQEIIGIIVIETAPIGLEIAPG